MRKRHRSADSPLKPGRAPASVSDGDDALSPSKSPRLDRALHAGNGGVSAVLHLEPGLRRPRLIRAVCPLAHDALEAKAARVCKYRGAIAFSRNACPSAARARGHYHHSAQARQGRPNCSIFVLMKIGLPQLIARGQDGPLRPQADAPACPGGLAEPDIAEAVIVMLEGYPLASSTYRNPPMTDFLEAHLWPRVVQARARP
jgi:hypothetical protein